MVTSAPENFLTLPLVCVWCVQQDVMGGLFLVSTYGVFVRGPCINRGVTALGYSVLRHYKLGLFLLWPATVFL